VTAYAPAPPRAASGKRGAVVATALPFVLPVLMLVALFLVPPMMGRTANIFSVYNSLQSFSGLGLVALGLGLTMIIGEFDLSVVGTYALGGMIAVKLGVDSPVTGVLAAVAVCSVLGALQGVVVARFGINSMAVTLGGYLVALGLTGTIGDNKSLAYLNFDLSARLNQPVAEVFSVRSLVALAVVVVVIAVLMATRVGRDMRATGGGRRASRTAGVRVDVIVTLTFVASAALAALGGALQSYGLATATSNPGLSPLIFGVTASLLGGIALTGGRGTPLGIAAGAVGLCFFSQLFTTLATPQYVISLLTGGLLIAVTVSATPSAARLVGRARHGRRPRSSSTPSIPAAEGRTP
jgi:ribose transport system permease protein